MPLPHHPTSHHITSHYCEYHTAGAHAAHLQPRISEWPLSTTRLLPCLRASRPPDTPSAMMPIIKAKMSIPPTVNRKAMSRPPEDSTSACVPGSATNVQALQSADEEGAPTLRLPVRSAAHKNQKV